MVLLGIPRPYFWHVCFFPCVCSCVLFSLCVFVCAFFLVRVCVCFFLSCVLTFPMQSSKNCSQTPFQFYISTPSHQRLPRSRARGESNPLEIPFNVENYNREIAYFEMSPFLCVANHVCVFHSFMNNLFRDSDFHVHHAWKLKGNSDCGKFKQKCRN
jgi:hypothetical protein